MVGGLRVLLAALWLVIATADPTTTTLTISATNPQPYAVDYVVSVAVTTPGGASVLNGQKVDIFLDGASSALITLTLNSNGQQSLQSRALSSLEFLSVGSHTITATFKSTPSLATSSDNKPITIAQSTTDIEILVAPEDNSVVYGQAPTYKVSVTAPGRVQPFGTINLALDGVSQGTVATLVSPNSDVTFSINTLLSLGDHTAVFFFSPDASQTANFAGDNTDTGGITVLPDSTTTTVTSSSSQTLRGGALTFTIKVNRVGGSQGTPVGSVVLTRDGTTTLPTISFASFTTSPGGITATYDASGLAAGAFSVTAAFTPEDSNYLPSDNTASPLAQKILGGATTTTITSTNPLTYGNPLTFTVQVDSTLFPPSGSPVGTPTGQVKLFKNNVELPSSPQTLSSSRQATFTVSGNLDVGTYNFKATYVGDSSYDTSDSTVLAQQIAQDDAITTIFTSRDPPFLRGSAFTITVGISRKNGASGTPSGTVRLQPFSPPVEGTLDSTGTHVFDGSTLPAGSFTLSAVYVGDTNYKTSTSHDLSEVILGGATTTTITSTNPLTYGNPLTFTVQVDSTLFPPSGTTVGTPTGQVKLFKNDVELPSSPQTLSSSRQATFTVSGNLDVGGTYNIKATYVGDSSYDTSDSTVLDQQIVQDDSLTTITADNSQILRGGELAITVAVARKNGASGIPSGTVRLQRDHAAFSPPVEGTLDSTGTFVFDGSTFAAGSFILSAVYVGDTNYKTSSSTGLPQVVIGGATTTTITPSDSPATFGNELSFSIAVTSNLFPTRNPTGSVKFEKDGVSLAASLPLDSGTATYNVPSPWDAGTYSITATYTSDTGIYDTSDQTIGETINPDATDETITSSVESPTYGQSIRFTVTVLSHAHPLTGNPTGQVRISSDLNGELTVTDLDAHVATYDVAYLKAGTHVITADYLGARDYASSTKTFTQTVSPDHSATTLSSSNTDAFKADEITFTATVTPVLEGSTQIPTGSVTFKEGSITLGTGAVPLDAGHNTATLKLSTLTPGVHHITAHYSGDNNFIDSDSTSVTQNVFGGSTTTTVVSSSLTSVYEDSLTLTITVKSQLFPVSGKPTGNVNLFIEGAHLTLPLVSGVATYTNPNPALSIFPLPAGVYHVDATYVGDDDYDTSDATEIVETITPAPSTVTLDLDQTSPVTYWTGVTLTATVTRSASGTPTGTVTFKDGTKTLNTIGLDNQGVATFFTQQLEVGTHSLSVSYVSDNSNYGNDDSDSKSFEVDKSGTVVNINAGTGTINLGDSFTYTANIRGIPDVAITGTVTFFVDGVAASSPRPVSPFPSKASFDVVFNSLGSHTVSATYSGDDHYSSQPSSNSDTEQVVPVVCRDQLKHGYVRFVQGNPLVPAPQYGLSQLSNPNLFASDFSIAFWLKRSSLSQGEQQVIFSHGYSDETEADTALSAGFRADDSFFFGFNQDEFEFTHAATTDVGVWHHYTIVFDSFDVVQVVYVDGQLAGASSDFGDYQGDASFLNFGAGLVRHGADDASLHIDRFEGSLDEFRVYGSTRFTPADVRSQLATLTWPDGALLYLSFDGPSGDVTFPNGITWQQYQPVCGEGLSGLAYASYSDYHVAHLVDLETATPTSIGYATSFQDPNTGFGSVYTALSYFAQLVFVSPQDIEYQFSIAHDNGADLLLWSTGDVPSQTPVDETNPAVVVFEDSNTESESTQGDAVPLQPTTTTYFINENYFNSDNTHGPAQNEVYVTKFPGGTTTIGALNQASDVEVKPLATFPTSVHCTGGPAHSSVDTCSVPSGFFPALCTFTCDEGYLARGSNRLICNPATAKWDADGHCEAPTAIAVQTLKLNVGDGISVSVGSILSSSPASGSVLFYTADWTFLGFAALNANGQATSPALSSVGTSDVNVYYVPSTTGFRASTQVATVTVQQAQSTVVITQSFPNPSVFGESVNVLITVQGSGATPSGSVTLFRASSLGPVSLGEFGLDDTGSAIYSHVFSQFPFDSLPTTFGLTASYSGDDNYAPSQTVNTFTQDLNKGVTSLSLNAAKDFSEYGDQLGYTATVSIAKGVGSFTGTVTFKLDGVAFADGTKTVTSVSPTATYTTAATALATGTHTITADYSGDADFDVSTASVFQHVKKATTTLTVTDVTNPSVYGTTFTLNVHVSSKFGQVPPGTVAVNGDASFQQTLDLNGNANIIVPALFLSVQGTPYHLSVAYTSTDELNFKDTTTPHDHSVTQAPTSVTLTSSDDLLALFGEELTFTASVASTSAGTPTGTVKFYADGLAFSGDVSPNQDGTYTATTNFLSVTPSSPHQIVAIYSGDNNFQGNQQEHDQFIAQDPTTTNLVSPNPDYQYGQQVTITVQVVAVAPGSGHPTGTVEFKEGALTLDTKSVNSQGKATFQSSSPFTVGTHAIQVAYDGDGSYAASVLTGGVTVTVLQADTSVSITSPDTVYGERFDFTITVTSTAPGAATPNGEAFITLLNLEFDPVPVTITNGVGSYTQSDFLLVQSYTFVATFQENTNFKTSSSNDVHVVSKADVTISLDTSKPVAGGPNPVYGEVFTLTATVSPKPPSLAIPGDGLPTVAFKVAITDGLQTLGYSHLQSGQATFDIGGAIVLTAGDHTLYASFIGDGKFHKSSDDAQIPEHVDQAGTTTTLSPFTASVSGETVTFTVTVKANTPSAGYPPLGKVVFSDVLDGVTSDPLDLTPSITAPFFSVASFQTTLFTVSDLSHIHRITANYLGDNNFASTSDTQTQEVDKSPSNTVVTSNHLTAVIGESVTLTATVSAGSHGSGTPTGTVTFSDGGVTLQDGADVPLDAEGKATYTTALLAVNPDHHIQVDYSGDDHFISSIGKLDEEVDLDTVTVTLSNLPATSVWGQEVVLTADLAPSGLGFATVTGFVDFYDGDTLLPDGHRAISENQAVYRTSALSVGSHNLKASYTGDNHFSPRDSDVVPQEVDQASSTIDVSSTVVPFAVWGQPVTLKVQVSASGLGHGIPSGDVEVKEGTHVITTLTLDDSGFAHYDIPLFSLAPAIHTLTFHYKGDVDFTDFSKDFAQEIKRASTQTTVSSSSQTSSYGQDVTFTITVSPTGFGSGVPTGDVTVTVDSEDPFPLTLSSAGSITFDRQFLLATGDANPHVISVSYPGDDDFVSSASDPFLQTVNSATTTLLLDAVPTSSVYGEAVVLTARITPAYGGVPAGTVTFTDTTKGTSLGSQDLDLHGVATVTVTAFVLTVGEHDIQAHYSGETQKYQSTDSTTVPYNVALDTTTSSIDFTISVTYPAVSTLTATVQADDPGSGFPDGTVDFFEEGQAIALKTGATLQSGVAVFSTLFTPTTHKLYFVYSGSERYKTSTSPSKTLTVSPDSTTTTVTSDSPDHSVFGQFVKFTATVVGTDASSVAAPTGSVTFSIDGIQVDGDPAPVVDGKATYTTTAAYSVGNHLVRADYSGDNFLFTSSFDDTFTQHVALADTKTVVVPSVLPSSKYGQEVTFDVSITPIFPGAGTLTGAITVTIDDVPFTIADNTGTVSAAGAASFKISSLSATTHSITVTYTGDGSFSTSHKTFSYDVQQADTSVQFTSPPQNPSRYGQGLTFTIAVSVVGPGVGTPDGTNNVLIEEVDGTGAVIWSTPLTLTSGSTQYTTSAFKFEVGTHTIRAVYLGADNFAASQTGTGTGDILQEVDSTDTTTHLSVTETSPSTRSQFLHFSVSVEANDPGTGVPTGTVQFFDTFNGVTTSFSATITLDGDGKATYAYNQLLALGAHSIQVNYVSDSNHYVNSPSNAVPQVIQKGATKITITAPGSSVFGEGITLQIDLSTAKLNDGTPTGAFTLQDNGVAVVGSPFTFTTVLPNGATEYLYSTSSLSVGSHAFTAHYNGDDNYATSDAISVTQTVNPGDVEITLTPSLTSSFWGQQVTFSVSVAAHSPAAGVPTGSVAFYNGPDTTGTPIATKGLVSQQASFTTNGLAVGSQHIIARYSGDGNFNPGQKSTDELVNKDLTSSAITSTVSTQQALTPVTFTLSVSITAPGSGIVTGQVDFYDHYQQSNQLSLGSSQISSGVATFTTSSLAVGSHAITGVYAGDGHFLGSPSNAFPITITQRATSISVTGSATSTNAGVTSYIVPLGKSVITLTVAPTTPPSGTPTGDVTVGGTPHTLSAGSVSFIIFYPTTGVKTLSVSYPGDAQFAAASATLNLVVYVTTAPNGQYMLGDKQLAIGNSVTFYGSNWATVNKISSGTIPTGFLGYDDPSDTGSTACNNAWQSTIANQAAGANQPVVNIAQYLSATATSSGSATTSNAFDNDFTTLWSPPNGPNVQITVDLGSVRSITNLAIWWSSKHATNYQILSSNDDISYQLVAGYSLGNPATANPTETFNLQALSLHSRYLRLSIIDGYDASNPTVNINSGDLKEFQVFGPTDFHSQYINTFVTKQITLTNDITTNPPTKRVSGTVNKFGVVQVASTTSSSTITSTGSLAALYCPIVQSQPALFISPDASFIDSSSSLLSASNTKKPKVVRSGGTVTIGPVRPLDSTAAPTHTPSAPKATTPVPTTKPKATTTKPTTKKPKATTTKPKATTTKPKATTTKPKATTTKPKATTHKPTTHKPTTKKPTTKKPTTKKPTTKKPTTKKPTTKKPTIPKAATKTPSPHRN